MSKSKINYVDVGGPQGLSESDRIDMIGTKAMLGNKVGVLIDGEKYDPGKVDRYIKKVMDKFRGLEVTFRGPYFKDESIMAVVFERKKD